MKKFLLLSGFALSTMFASAQTTVIWSDNFDDSDVSDWTLIDVDGDNFNWSAVQIEDEDGFPVGTPVLRSASWNQVIGPLTPNNWAITPVIDLSAYPAGSTISLDWFVMAIDASYDQENYSVYVSTSNDPTAMLTSPVTFSETTLDGVNELSPRTLDISSMAGESAVYVAFRHYGTTDVFTMEIDDVSVSGTALGTEDFFRNNLAMYPNPVNDVLTIDSKTGTINNVRVTDVNGRMIKNINASGLATSRINTSDLTSGVYFVTVETAEGSGTSKFIKK